MAARAGVTVSLFDTAADLPSADSASLVVGSLALLLDTGEVRQLVSAAGVRSWQTWATSASVAAALAAAQAAQASADAAMAAAAAAQAAANNATTAIAAGSVTTALALSDGGSGSLLALVTATDGNAAPVPGAFVALTWRGPTGAVVCQLDAGSSTNSNVFGSDDAPSGQVFARTGDNGTVTILCTGVAGETFNAWAYAVSFPGTIPDDSRVFPV